MEFPLLSEEWDTFNEVVTPQGSFTKDKDFKKLPRNKPNGMYEFFVPVWTECLRILKPGAFAFVFIGARQDTIVKQLQALADAGFRTDFTSLYWTYATGFPKAMNISKAVDKKLEVEQEIIGDSKYSQPAKSGHFGGLSSKHIKYKDNRDRYTPKVTKATSKEAINLNGSYGGFQPKPAVEVILVAMKPLVKKTYVEQALDNGKGITWLDDCRIPTDELKDCSDRNRKRSENNLWKTNETINPPC